jgi:hypothetical protein
MNKIVFSQLVTGPGSFANVQFDGGSSFGNSPTLTEMQGANFLGATNTHTVEIGGLLAGNEFDKIVSTGTVNLDGALNVQLINIGNNYVPTNGDRFTIISAAAVSGMFSHVTFPAAPAGSRWRLEYGSTAVTAIFDEAISPAVTKVFVTGSTWHSSFIDAIDGGGVGAGNGLGYELVPGLVIPNSRIDRIYIQFSEPVVGFHASTFELLGVEVPDYAANLTVSYDGDRRLGIISLSNATTIRERFRIGISDAVTDLAANTLDGDSNDIAGGAFDLQFNVLVGDANNDGSVNGGDLPFFAASFNKSVGSPEYDARADWNVDRSVNGGDLSFFAANFNKSLPANGPGEFSFEDEVTEDTELSDSVDLIDEVDQYFSSLVDEEEEWLNV